MPPVAHRTLAELEAGLDHVAAAPRDRGTLEMLVVRPAVDERATPAAAACTVEGGIEGDDWATRGSQHTEDGSANPDQQLAVINARYLDLVAGGRQRWPLAGDQLVVDLDLSEDHLQPGDRLRIGRVQVEVTPHPHNGCAKFRRRFGLEAVRLTLTPLGQWLHLRGIYVRVVVPGTLHVGDPIERVAATAQAADR